MAEGPFAMEGRFDVMEAIVLETWESFLYIHIYLSICMYILYTPQT